MTSWAPASRASRALSSVLDGADHPGAEAPRDLAEQQAHPAGGGVHQAGIAGPQGIGAVGEVVRGEALQDRGGGEARIHPRGKRDGAVGRHEGVLGVPSDQALRHDPVTDTAGGDAFADLLHHAGRLAAERDRQGSLVESLPMVHIDEVDSGRLDPDQHLLLARHRDEARPPGAAPRDRRGYGPESPSPALQVGDQRNVRRPGSDADQAAFRSGVAGIGEHASIPPAERVRARRRPARHCRGSSSRAPRSGSLRWAQVHLVTGHDRERVRRPPARVHRHQDSARSEARVEVSRILVRQPETDQSAEQSAGRRADPGAREHGCEHAAGDDGAEPGHEDRARAARAVHPPARRSRRPWPRRRLCQSAMPWRRPLRILILHRHADAVGGKSRGGQIAHRRLRRRAAAEEADHDARRCVSWAGEPEVPFAELMGMLLESGTGMRETTCKLRGWWKEPW